MISRQWRGLASTQEAANYIRHLQEDTFPQLSTMDGFVDASILQRRVPEGVEFLIVTRWQSLAAIRQFAGNDEGRAVVPEKVQAMMVSWDSRVLHYEIVQ